MTNPEETVTNPEETVTNPEDEKPTLVKGAVADLTKAPEGTSPDGTSPDEGTPDDGTAPDDDAIPDEGIPDEGAPDEPGVRRGIDWARVLAYGLLPGLVLALALVAGLLKYSDNTQRNNADAGVESARAAKDSTITILSYTPDKVEAELNDARNLLTGDFRESYTALINDVVIPGAKQQQISAVATVPAVASVTATSAHAVALVFVNQTVAIGGTPPTASASSVRVTLDKVGGKWLISQFEPV